MLMALNQSVSCVSKHILPGIQNGRLCVDPNGNFAFILNEYTRSMETFSFVRIDLMTGKRSSLKTEKIPEEIGSRTNQRLFCHNCIALVRSSKLFIYSCFSTCNENDCMIVSFTVNDNIVSIFDVHCISLSLSSISIPGLHKIENSKLLLIAYQNNKSITTSFDEIEIKIDDSDKMTSITLVKDVELTDCWLSPCFYGGYCYWLSTKMAPNSIKLLKTLLDGKNIEEIDIRNETGDELEKLLFSNAKVIENRIFFYAYSFNKCVGVLLKLDIQKRCLREVSVDAKNHIIRDNAEIDFAENSFLYFHGECGFANCIDKAHIHVVDVRNELNMDENTTVEANIASLQMKAECSTLSWRTEVMQFMSITEYGINELGEKYDSLQKEYDILRQDITAEISQLSSNNDGIWIERLQTLEKDMVQTLAGVEERYSQKLFNHAVNSTTFQHVAFGSDGDVADQFVLMTPEILSDEQKVLTKHMSTLCHKLIIDEVLVALQSEFVLSAHEAESINAERTSFARNYAFLKHLLRRDGQAFLQFIQSLRKTNQHYLANILSSSEPTDSSSKKMTQQNAISEAQRKLDTERKESERVDVMMKGKIDERRREQMLNEAMDREMLEFKTKEVQQSEDQTKERRRLEDEERERQKTEARKQERREADERERLRVDAEERERQQREANIWRQQRREADERERLRVDAEERERQLREEEENQRVQVDLQERKQRETEKWNQKRKEEEERGRQHIDAKARETRTEETERASASLTANNSKSHFSPQKSRPDSKASVIQQQRILKLLQLNWGGKNSTKTSTWDCFFVSMASHFARLPEDIKHITQAKNQVAEHVQTFMECVIAEFYSADEAKEYIVLQLAEALDLRKASNGLYSLYGNDYSPFVEHLEHIATIRCFAKCSNSESCPQPITHRDYKGFTLPSNAANIYDAIIHQLSNRTRAVQCRQQFKEKPTDPRTYTSDADSENKSTKYYCTGTLTKHGDAQFLQKDPFVIFIGLNEMQAIDWRKLPEEITILGIKFYLGSCNVSGVEHFTSIVKITSEWFYYDGLASPLFIPYNHNQRMIVEKLEGKKLTYAFYYRAENENNIHL